MHTHVSSAEKDFLARAAFISVSIVCRRPAKNSLISTWHVGRERAIQGT